MSPQPMARSAWSSARWLWLLLALCLIAWRVSSRVEQYHQPTSIAATDQQGQVSFFDVNERNTSSVDAMRRQARLLAAEQDGLFSVPQPKLPVHVAYRPEPERLRLLPQVYVDPVTLFSNPPPALA